MSHLTPMTTLRQTRSSTPIAARTPGRYRMPTPSLRTPARSRLLPKASSPSMCLSTNGHREGDRFIPSRSESDLDLCRRSLLMAMSGGGSSVETDNDYRSYVPRTHDTGRDFSRNMMSAICNFPLDELTERAEPRALFRYSDKKVNRSRQKLIGHPCDPSALHGLPFALPPKQRESSHKKSAVRKFASRPARILDAPDFLNDYYSNLLSWSKDNCVAVALLNDVYTWNAVTGEATNVFSLPEDERVKSVSWAITTSECNQLAVGTDLGELILVDGSTGRVIRKFAQPDVLDIDALSWSPNGCVSAGGTIGNVFDFDPRVAADGVVSRYGGFVSRNCGLAWNEDGTTLAGGFEENNVYLWDARMSNEQQSGALVNTRCQSPRVVLNGHIGAVKALGWCPSRRGWLASGGGNRDGTIKVWNSCNGDLVSSTSTVNQVTSLLWTRDGQELVSSHGSGSLRRLALWKRSSNNGFDLLHDFHAAKEHDERILAMAASPDGRQVATVGSGEKLVFWDIDDNVSTSHSLRSTLGKLEFLSPVIR